MSRGSWRQDAEQIAIDSLPDSQLTSRDLSILADVARFRLASGKQIQRLHFGEDEAAARAARRALARLVNRRAMVRLPRVVGGVRAGSAGYVYGLGPLGDRLLRSGRARSRRSDVADGFIAHTLAIAELYVELVNASRRGAFEILSITTEPATWQQLGGLTRTDWLKPDLQVVLGVGDDERHSYVEWDRGTEHAPALLRKLRQYETAYRQRSGDFFPEVVWLVPTTRRAERLRQLIRQNRALTSELHAVGLHAEALALLGGVDAARPAHRQASSPAAAAPNNN